MTTPSASASAPPAPAQRNKPATVLFASLIGTTVEFFDFYIYATAASLVFGQLFFPSKSASLQQMAAFASLGVAFLARPLGAIAFGHFGDRVGRKSTLVASLVLMGGSTLAIAFLPTYAMAGWLAPTLLCLLRFGQGFGLGGEWGGAALLAVENAPPGWRARFGMFPQLGAPVGFIAANGLFLILGLVLTPEQFLAWGWRLPFLGSAALVAVGLWVRLKLTETPAFAAAIAHEPPPAVPLGELLRGALKSSDNPLTRLVYLRLGASVARPGEVTVLTQPALLGTLGLMPWLSGFYDRARGGRYGLQRGSPPSAHQPAISCASRRPPMPMSTATSPLPSTLTLSSCMRDSVHAPAGMPKRRNLYCASCATTPYWPRA